MSVFNQRFAEYHLLIQGYIFSLGKISIQIFCFCLLLLNAQIALSQDVNCNTTGLVCNNNLQISISYDCSLDLDIDRFIENPIEGVEYSLQFFDHHKRPIPTLTEKEIGSQISYSVTCGGNTCSGHIILESNHLPVFDAPCQIRQGQVIPSQCRTWCGTDIPSIFIELDEMDHQMEDMCLPQFLGDIKQTLVREGDICDPNGETVTLIHEVKILTHGTLKVVELLRQSVIQQKIDLDTSAINPVNSIVFPENLSLNCDEGYTPEHILLSDNHYHDAYPIYIDKHNMVPDSIYRCDTFILETIIGFRDTVIATDTIDGILVWEQLTVVDKEFEDSIVCAILPILNPDSTVVLVPNEVPLENRLCNIAAAYTDVEYSACGNGKKIIRHWKIIDWCAANVELSDPQTIEVTDTEKPVILEEITEMDILIEPWACSARGKLPTILAEDNCGEVLIEWYSDEGIIQGDIISELWIQNSPIILTAYVGDACDNIDTLNIEVNIIDDTPPVAICNTSMQIVLTGGTTYEFDNGTAKLFAKDFDEGSHDAQCGEVEFFVVRAEDWSIPVTNCDGEFIGYSPESCSAKTEVLDLGELKSKQCEFSGKNRRPIVTKPADFIKFCCEDANKFIDVIFIAQDKAGNTNECLVTILVENTNGPELICEDVVITCEEDIHSVKRPELIDGEICPVSFLPIQYASESVNRTNCDSIVVTREWYVDANSDDEFGVGDPHCFQHITIVGANDEVEFICEDLVLPCTVEIDSIPLPKIEGNQFCICDESLVKVGSFRYTNNNQCEQDTLIVEWYFDADGNDIPEISEAGCTQRIALSSNPDLFVIECQAVTISCSQSLAEAQTPVLAGLGDNCICPEDFLKTEYVGQVSDNCINNVIQRSWYIDSNLNNRREDSEQGCIQDITIDYSQVNYELRCSNLNLTCDDDPDLFFDDPEIIQIDVCECPDPIVYLLDESRSNNECAIDTITRKWFLDVNGNETYDIEEPKCQQYLFINNLASPVNIICEDANVDCLDQLSGLFIPIVENQNSCGCTGNQLELRSQSSLDGLCYGDVITREWYVDINLNNNFDNNEPSCIQNLTLTTPEESPNQNDAMTFECTPISVTCIENIDNAQAPSLVSTGLCQCGNINVNLNGQSSSDNVCVGDTIFREWYADLNNNNSFDSQEPFCNQALIIVGSPVTSLVCTDEVIACTDNLNTIPGPRVMQDGFCNCDDIQPRLLSESPTTDLCVGDAITRMWYLDINENGQSDEDEPFCEQSISIQDVFPGQIDNCGEISISCDTDITNLVPTLTVGEGICSCEQGVNLLALDTGVSEQLCFNDTLQRSWFIDINNNGLQEAEEPDCQQTLIVNIQDTLTLSCIDYTIGCIEQNPPLVPPTIVSGTSCQCDNSQVLLRSEFGAEDGCVGDTLFREWYADVNNNGVFDQTEAQCTQHIILVDDNAFVSFDCQAISISCTTDPSTLVVPSVSIESACGCMEFVPVLFRDGLSDTLCVGDTSSRMWYIDLDADNFADEDEPYCLQSITIVSDDDIDISILSDTTSISCSTDIDSLIPAAQFMQGFCSCEESVPFVLIDQGVLDYCINDTITREWIIDLNQNDSLDTNENIFMQVLIIEASMQSIDISCADQFVNCQFEQVAAQLPMVTTADGCSCSEIPVLIQSQFGAVERCVGDTLFRVWYADINGDNNFNPSTEPTCTQNIILQDSEAMVSFECENVSISCQTVADSIPLPNLITDSGCGCMDIQPTLLSDGSLAGICFGESFTREWYVDMNNDGIPQTEEASCRQVITVDGSMSDMTFNCQEQIITCLDTLANIAPPEINTVGICTCNQFDLSIAQVVIDGSVCVGDTIIQRWFVDSNPNNQFDSLDISCDQMLILEGEAQADFLCADVPISCDADIDAIPPPAILGEGLCSCTELPTILISQSDTTGQMCIGDEITREWYLDMNSDAMQDDDDPVCVQRFIIIGQNDNFEFQGCDTLTVSCTDDFTTLNIPTIMSVGECSCDTIQVLEINPMLNLQLCSMDTIIRQFYGDSNKNNEFNDGEPTCDQVIIVENSSPPFDPFTIKWPNIFTGETFSGTQLICENDSLTMTEEFIQTGEAFNCMPQDFDSKPLWCDSECGLVTFSIQRDTTDAIDACFKIRNSYTIIDWCTFDPAVTDTLETDQDEFEIVKDLSPGSCENCDDNGAIMQDSVYFRYVDVEQDGVYQFVQEISVQDDEPPIITVMEDTVYVDVAAMDTSMLCLASIDITAEAMDMCDGQPTSDEMIQWTIRIVDEDRNMVPNPDGPNIETSFGGMATVNSRNGMPGDTFSIVWTVRDGCNAASIRETQVIFFDTTGVCDTMTSSAGIIAGEIHTETGIMIENAMVALNKVNQVDIDYAATNPTGTFAFYNNPMHYNYKINVSRDDSFSNGVSTVDLILIYNHIVGDIELDSPYKIIAADANDDQNISVKDIAEIKKLILQSSETLSNNKSWRFLKESQQFFDQSVPWPFVEVSNIVDLQHDMMDEDFIGVKIGDVNGDATANRSINSEIRTVSELVLSAADKVMSANQVHTFHVNTNTVDQIQGIQGTFEFIDLEIVDIESGSLSISNKDYYIQNNQLTISAHKIAKTDAPHLFSIKLRATKQLRLSESITLNSKKTEAQIYLKHSLDHLTPILSFSSPINTVFDVAQNRPNPFSFETAIDITLPDSGITYLSIFNVTGQIVYQSVENLKKGPNTVNLKSERLPHQGLYTYMVEFDGKKIIKQMLLID